MTNQTQPTIKKPIIEFLKKTKDGKYTKIDPALLNCKRVSITRQNKVKTYVYGIK